MSLNCTSLITDDIEGIFPVLLAIIKIFMNCLLRCLHTYSVTQSCPTLCDPLDSSLPGSSVHGDSPGENTGVGCCFPPPEYLPDPGIETASLESPELGGRFFTKYAT